MSCSQSRPNVVRVSRRGPAGTRGGERPGAGQVQPLCGQIGDGHGLRLGGPWTGSQSASTPRSPVRTRATSCDRDAPDLAVADPAGLGGLEDDVDDVLAVDVVDQHLQPDLRDEVHGVLRAAVDLAVAALPAVAAGLAHRHARDPEGLQGLLDLVQLVRLDDRGDEFHADAPCVGDADGAECVPTGGRVAVVHAHRHRSGRHRGSRGRTTSQRAPAGRCRQPRRPGRSGTRAPCAGPAR